MGVVLGMPRFVCHERERKVEVCECEGERYRAIGIHIRKNGRPAIIINMTSFKPKRAEARVRNASVVCIPRQ